MSLIITYTNKKGCVMVADKRRIAYFGVPEQRELLEKELYSGAIKTDEDLYKRAKELDVTIKITDDASKIRSVSDVAVGEVTTKTTTESKRRRIYATTNFYKIVELVGSEVKNTEFGENSIVMFGNAISKKLANESLKKNWRKNTSLRYVAEILNNVFEDVASQTPSIGNEFDSITKFPKFDKNKALKVLDETSKRDLNALQKWRENLKLDLLEKAETIKLSERIVDEGEIGKVSKVDDNQLEIVLNPDIEAFNSKWKPLAKPGEKILLILMEDVEVNIGDKVVIADGKLCMEKKKADLSSELILCHAE